MPFQVLSPFCMYSAFVGFIFRLTQWFLKPALTLDLKVNISRDFSCKELMKGFMRGHMGFKSLSRSISLVVV